MASELRVNTINSRTGFGTITVSETGQDLVGITTIENLTTENTLVGAAASFTGNVQIGGVLTYEDVTNIDSVGLITARQGIEIGARPGVGASISADGNMIVSGISTFGGSLKADGGVDASSQTVTVNELNLADTIVHGGDSNTKIRFPAADTITAETGGTERARIDSSGNLLLGTSTSIQKLTIDSGGISLDNGWNTQWGADASRAYIQGEDSNGNDRLILGTTNTERLRIDENGYVGIKLTDPHLYYAKDLVVKSIDQGGITIRSTGTSDTQYVMFADGTSGNERYRGYVGYQHNTGSGGEHLQLAASGSLVVRVDSDGLKFGSDTAAANALDDYEEGTWTPNVIDGNGSNYTIQVDTARYTKIGRLIHCHYQIKRTENGSKTGTLRISNIPFAHDGTSIQGGNWWCDHGSPTDGLGDIIGGIHSIGSGTTNVYFVKPTDESGMGTASTRYLEHGQWTLNRWIYGSFIYYSAT